MQAENYYRSNVMGALTIVPKKEEEKEIVVF